MNRNISHQTRNKITDYFKDYAANGESNEVNQALTVEQILTVIKIFDNAIREINRVLNSCFVRFHGKNGVSLRQISVSTTS